MGAKARRNFSRQIPLSLIFFLSATYVVLCSRLCMSPRLAYVPRDKLVSGVFYARTLVDQFLRQFSFCVGCFSRTFDSVELRPLFNIA